MVLVLAVRGVGELLEEGVRRVVKRAGVAPSEAIAIGDEVRDLEAARGAGIAFGAVTWGYAAEEALRAREPDVVFEKVGDVVRGVVGRD